MPAMTLNLPEAEMAMVDELAMEQEKSKTAVIRDALKLYAMVIVADGRIYTEDAAGVRTKLVIL